MNQSTSSTPTTLAWLQEELDTVPWPPDGDGLERLESLPWLNAVIKETLRLVPPVGGFFRRVIQVSTSATQRDGREFSEPGVFRPERHLQGPPPGAAYVPFGVGPRVCLGKPCACPWWPTKTSAWR